MVDNDLKEFIKEQRNKGLTDKQIEEMLLNHGWKFDEVKVTFDSIELNVPLPKVHPSDTRVDSDITLKEGSRSDIWDAFENVIMFITMGFVAISIGLLINYFVDDAFLNTPSYGYSSISSESASIYSAVLVVSLPIFTVLFLRITKRTKENPDLKNKIVRKILTYITMIITSIIVIINLILVVFRLLTGELGVEDFFDFVIIVGIGSLVFYYFLTQTKEDRKK